MLVCWTLFLRRKIIFKRKKITFFNQIIQFRVFTEIFLQIEVEVYTGGIRFARFEEVVFQYFFQLI